MALYYIYIDTNPHNMLLKWDECPIYDLLYILTAFDNIYKYTSFIYIHLV